MDHLLLLDREECGIVDHLLLLDGEEHGIMDRLLLFFLLLLKFFFLFERSIRSIKDVNFSTLFFCFCKYIIGLYVVS